MREPTVRDLIEALRTELREGFASMNARLDVLEAAAQRPKVARMILPTETANGPTR